MSLLKHILSPFVEFKEEAQPQQQPQTPAPPGTAPKQPTAPKSGAPAAAPQPAGPEFNDPLFQPTIIPVPVADNPFLHTPVPTMTGPAVATPEHLQHFERLIEEANAKNPLFSGTDYKEFIDGKIDLQSIPDEATRYQTAFNVLKRTGLTRERLLSTGQEYINIIGRDMNGFKSAYATRYQKEVKAKEDAAKKKIAEVKALADKIAALQAEIQQLADEAKATRATLDAAKHSYLMAGENKQREILTELQKIEQYF